ncbi:Uncharacterised protein [Mycoplasmopsis columbinasalis]|uniref:Uncharacterized protein n=1 Tax=Mycoplasmopsis columbinasalis TaxID=114880 RepID=A0A449BA77_9BACT|nr:Uncharacterised protein [Mycoplasmopsis columbinasalis]
MLSFTEITSFLPLFLATSYTEKINDTAQDILKKITNIPDNTANNTQSGAYYVADLITPVTKENTLNAQITKIYLNQTTGTFSFGFKVYKKVNNTNVEVDNRKHMLQALLFIASFNKKIKKI